MHVQVTVVRELIRGVAGGPPQLRAVEVDYAGRLVVIELPAYVLPLGSLPGAHDQEMAQAMDDLAEALQQHAAQLRTLLPPGHP